MYYIISNIKAYKYLLLSNDSYITFKINTNELKLFFPYDKKLACKHLTLPDIFEANEANYTDISINYTVNQITKKEVKLIWKNNNQPKSTECLFEKCYYFTEIDLSNFDSSQVTSMYKMFHLCSILISLNLSNLNTSNVEIMDSLFYGCKSLDSLDLSQIVTSSLRQCFIHFVIVLN